MVEPGDAFLVGGADLTERAGVAGAGYGMGVAVGDYDNDGRPDIFLANVTGNQMFHNKGDGTFTDVTAKTGLAGAEMNGKKMWSVGAGWFDYNNDGKVDIFFTNGAAIPSLEKDSPKFFNRLYRNDGGMKFTDVTLEAGVAGTGYSMGAAAAEETCLAHLLGADAQHDVIDAGLDRHPGFTHRSRARGAGGR